MRSFKNILFVVFITLAPAAFSQLRTDISLDNNWQTIAHDTNPLAYKGFEKASFKTSGWQRVNVPLQDFSHDAPWHDVRQSSRASTQSP